MLYKALIRPSLFHHSEDDAEKAHEFVLNALSRAGREPWRSMLAAWTHTPCLEREVFGIRFKNPIGFPAGLDKQGIALRGLAALGFGFGEVGTVLPRPQVGSSRPRIFRIPEEGAIINRMGFNSIGAPAVLENIRKHGMPDIPIGVNVGANKDTPVDQMYQDFLQSLTTLYEIASFFVFNVSSPNTPGLRDLQGKALLSELLCAGQIKLREIQRVFNLRRPKPLLVKMAPDLTPTALDEALQVCADHGVAGIIMGNTTLQRTNSHARHSDEQGGLSGEPLHSRMRAHIRHIHRVSPKLPIVAVGGLRTATQVRGVLDEGASLVQIYTGFVYEGPMLPSRLARGIWKVGPEPLSAVTA